MTQIELEDYNKLSACEKSLYNMYKVSHPEASHDQALAYAKICCSVEVPPEPIDITTLIKNAVKNAIDFLRRDIPRVYEKVKYALSNLMDRLTNAVEVTWDTIKRWINEAF